MTNINLTKEVKGFINEYANKDGHFINNLLKSKSIDEVAKELVSEFKILKVKETYEGEVSETLWLFFDNKQRLYIGALKLMNSSIVCFCGVKSSDPEKHSNRCTIFTEYMKIKYP